MRASRVAWAVAALLGPLAWGVFRFIPARWVEAEFATGVGQSVATVQGVVFGWIPVSLVELVVVGGGAALLVGAVRTLLRSGRVAVILRVLPRLLAATSLLYAIFVAAWGLNYQRPPLIGAFGFPVGPPTEAEVRALAEATVTAANAAREGVEEDAEGVARLAGSIDDVFVRAQRVYAQAGVRWPFLAGEYGEAKPLLFSWAASYWGLGGVYSPFTGEPNINVALPAFGLPFNVCHELAHQRGVAREDEANFVAFVVARDFGEPDFVYSAALDGASYATASLASTDRAGAARLMATLSPAVQRDLAARRRWHEEHATFVRAIGAAMNGSYLRSNGVKDGVNSYGRVVSLMVAERRGGGL